MGAMRKPPWTAATLVVAMILGACSTPPTPAATSSPSGQHAPSTASPTLSTSQPVPPTPSDSLVPTAKAAVWLDAGNLREARNTANVVVVGTGEVLVVGSDYLTTWQTACGAATNGSDSVEIGDPKARTWERTAGLSSPREDPAVVALSDGRALMTGGERGENLEPAAFSSTYVFDPTTRVWSRSGLLNTARSGAAVAVLLDGRVLVAGGVYSGGSQPSRVLDSSELWDPGSGAWSRTGTMATARDVASAVTLADGRVLVVGGMDDDSPVEQASTEVYDPQSRKWASAGTLATARRSFVLVALADGGALVAGGHEADGFALLSAVESFDPVSNTWSPADDLPVPVAGAAGIRLADGRVLLAGGSVRPPELIDEDAGTFVSGLTADALLFDPEEGTWTATTPMPKPRAGASAVLLPDGSAALVGGSASEGPFDTPGCPEADSQVLRYMPGS
jgi:N-acetylneuraminic acid mutarotase